MADFSRDATQVLRAAEMALSGRTAPGPAMHAHPQYAHFPAKGVDTAPWPSYDPNSAAAQVSEGDARTLELLRQLQVALGEIAALRSELTTEKDSRNATVAALGRRWKEEVLVELRTGDHHLRRDVAELQYQMGERLKEQAALYTVLRRQVEELQRAAKVQHSAHFDRQEQVQEELHALRAKVDAAMAQSAATRVECAQQLERERGSLSHRLDTELVRLSDMRSEGHKELQAAKGLIRSEMDRVGGVVRSMVDDAWQSCVAALGQSAKEAADANAAELKSTRAAVFAMEEKVEHCVRTCQAEARLLGTTLKERVAALESNEAVALSRLERAEKKADAAHDTTSRMDATLTGLKESSERAAATAQRASETALRAQDVLNDRDARLSQVEAQLRAVATAEQLRAELEACKRGTARAESQIDALGRVCERSEALAERTAKAADAAAGKVARCERLAEATRLAMTEFTEGQRQWTERVVAAEEVKERVAAAVEQQALATSRLEQRMGSAESKAKLLAERQSQQAAETQQQHLSLTTRVEAVQDAASRGEAVGVAAKSEVERLEKRLLQLESAGAAVTAECGTTRAVVEEATRDVDHLRRQVQQAKELQEARAARMDQRLAGLDKLEGAVAERISAAEQRVARQAEAVSERADGMAEQLGDRLQETFSRFEEHMGAELRSAVEGMTARVEAVERGGPSAARVAALDAAVEDVRRAVAALGGRLGALEGVEQTLSTLQDAVARSEHVLQREGARQQQQLQSLQTEHEADQESLRSQVDAHVKRLQRRLGDLEATLESHEGYVNERSRDAEGRLEVLQRSVADLAGAVARSATAPNLSTVLAATATVTTSDVSATRPALQHASRTPTEGSAEGHTPEGAGHLSGISPVRSVAGAAGGISPGSSLAHALQRTDDGAVAQRARLFDATSSSSRSKSNDDDRSRGPSSIGLPPQAPARSPSTAPAAEVPPATSATPEEPKRLPQPVTPPPVGVVAPPVGGTSASTTFLGGASTLGQHTAISRFVPVDDETTTTTSPHTRDAGRLAAAADDRDAASLTSSPSMTPVRRPAASAAWGESRAALSSEGTSGNDYGTALRTVEKQQPVAPPRDEAPLATDDPVSGGSARLPATSERADPPQASTNRFDEWDDDDDDDDDEAEAEAEGEDSDAVVALATPTRAWGADNGDDGDEAEVGSSPEPTGPQAAAALRATPRKDFLGDGADDPFEDEEVPRHGQATTSSSAATGSSAARASSGSQEAAAAAPPKRKYGFFDDDTSEDDD